MLPELIQKGRDGTESGAVLLFGFCLCDLVEELLHGKWLSDMATLHFLKEAVTSLEGRFSLLGKIFRYWAKDTFRCFKAVENHTTDLFCLGEKQPTPGGATAAPPAARQGRSLGTGGDLLPIPSVYLQHHQPSPPDDRADSQGDPGSFLIQINPSQILS